MKIKFGEVTVYANSLTATLYYVRDVEGFRVVEHKPIGNEYGVLEIEIETSGIMGGPAVTFREVGRSLRGELLDLSRHGSHASMDIMLPAGVLHARDGVGDWTKIVNFSTRKSGYTKD